MIGNDHRSQSIPTAIAFALALLACTNPAAAALDGAIAPPVASEAATTSVTLVCDGTPRTVETRATSVTALLAERGIRVAQDDYVSVPLDAPLTDGMNVEYRRAVLVDIFVGNRKRTVRSSAGTIGALLAEQRIGIDPRDDVSPPLDSPPIPNDVVHVTRVDAWTVRERLTVAPTVRDVADSALAAGTTRIVDPGLSGVRESTVRFVRRADSPAVRTVLASRIIRAPRARIVARGIVAYTSLARVAQQGFTSALHFAGSALQMIATAYTASCYGCSGITATGAHAGLGVIAVDPNVIPLGTKLFIPGYGRAIAGDTGAAIHGRRVDLGMNTLADALRFGRRTVTVYMLR